MRFLLIIIVLITVATVALQAWLGSPALQITFGQWVVELHPSVLLPVLLITFFVLYILFGALLAIKRVPQEYRRLRLLRRLKRKNACLEKGMLGLIEGDWRQAGRFLNEGARLSDNAPVYQLGLAQVADHEGRLMDRQMHLALARHVDKHGSLGAALTQARLLHARSDNANAIICLLEARKEHPHSQELNHFLLDVLQSEKRWTEVLAQLSYCRLAEGKQQLIQQRAYKHLLRQAAAVGDREALHSSWSRMPRSLKRTGEMVQVYVRACLQCGEAGSCESMLRSQLKHQDVVDIDLAMLYSMLPPEGLAKRVRFAERLLQKRGQDAGLLFIVGVLYLRLNQRQRGMEQLQSCARLQSWPEVHQLLAILAEQDGDFTSATRHYKMVGGLGADGALLGLLSVAEPSSSDASRRDLAASGQKPDPVQV